jgi:hypothetical protein
MNNVSEWMNSAIETVKSIPELMNALAEVVQTPYGWIPLALIILWFVVNKDFLLFLRFHSEKEKKKLDEIEKYLSDKDNVDPISQEVFVDIRTSRYFKVATGIHAEKKMRDALIDLHKNTSSNISWTTIRRALSLLKFKEDNSIEILKPNKIQTLGKYYNLSIGWLFVAFSAAIFLTMIASAKSGLLVLLFFLFLMITCLAMALFAFSQNFPLMSAMRIREEIGLLGDTSNET